MVLLSFLEINVYDKLRSNGLERFVLVDRYGKTLQAEGYLIESQRHGRAGYSLTKLLARLDNNIRLIDR